MCEKAAALGHVTEHKTANLTNGPGSPNVLINGRKAWRSEIDEHACPDHAKEVVYSGSDRVFINNHRAVRESDFLESNGAGAPNRINDGSSNVRIGATKVGLASADAMKEYCQDICALEHNWASLSPDDRRKLYEAAVKKQFDRMGMPAPTLEFFPATPGVGAYWNQGKWAIGLPDDTFTGSFNSWTMRQATYHELRHAEQTVSALRERAGRVPTPGRESHAASETDKGASSDPISAAELADITGVPPEVAQRAVDSPYAPNTPEARFGRINAEQHLTEAGIARSNSVNKAIWDASDRIKQAHDAGDRAAEDQAIKDQKEARDDYDHLPGGADATATADAFDKSCVC